MPNSTSINLTGIMACFCKSDKCRAWAPIAAIKSGEPMSHKDLTK